MPSGSPGTVGYTAAHGVRVNDVCPGWVRTQPGLGAVTYLSEREGISIDDAYTLVAEHVSLRRAAEPEEIASVCALLASPDTSITQGPSSVDYSHTADPTGALRPHPIEHPLIHRNRIHP